MHAQPIEIAKGGLQIAVNIAQGHALPPRELFPDRDDLIQAVADLPGETVRDYFDQVLLGAGVQESLDWLQEAGLLALVLPEIDATVNFTQELGRLHKDVWKHTKQVVAQAPAEVGLRWAALLHDIGKVPTRVRSITNRSPY